MTKKKLNCKLPPSGSHQAAAFSSLKQHHQNHSIGQSGAHATNQHQSMAPRPHQSTSNQKLSRGSLHHPNKPNPQEIGQNRSNSSVNHLQSSQVMNIAGQNTGNVINDQTNPAQQYDSRRSKTVKKMMRIYKGGYQNGQDTPGLRFKLTQSKDHSLMRSSGQLATRRNKTSKHAPLAPRHPHQQSENIFSLQRSPSCHYSSLRQRPKSRGLTNHYTALPAHQEYNLQIETRRGMTRSLSAHKIKQSPAGGTLLIEIRANGTIQCKSTQQAGIGLKGSLVAPGCDFSNVNETSLAQSFGNDSAVFKTDDQRVVRSGLKETSSSKNRSWSRRKLGQCNFPENSLIYKTMPQTLERSSGIDDIKEYSSRCCETSSRISINWESPERLAVSQSKKVIF